MSFSFNNPLEIGDRNKKIQNEIGNLQDLDTTDKSSLVNALNEALDSTLNGASRNLDNLSDVGEEKLRSLNSYANEGELLTDAEGLADVKNYAHSTFDASKFTVVGSPNITDDGIASGFKHDNYIEVDVTPSDYSTWELTTPLVKLTSYETETEGNEQQGFLGCSNSNNSYALSLRTSGNQLRYHINGTGVTISDTVFSFALNKFYQFKIKFTGTQYLIYGREIGQDFVLLDTKDDSNNVDVEFIYLGIVNTNNQYFGLYNGSLDLKYFGLIGDGVPVFSGNKTGIDTIKPDDYTVVGTPTISADGIASGFSSSNYLTVNPSNLILGNNFEIIVGFTTDSTLTGYQGLCRFLNSSNTAEGVLYKGNNQTRLECAFASNYYNIINTLSPNTEYLIKMKVQDNTYSCYYSTNNGKTWLQDNPTQSISINITNAIATMLIGNNTASYYWSGSIDLNAFKIYVDGNLVYQPCLKIPYTESKTGSKIVDSIYRDRVNDMAEQFGYANYYTLSDTDFTLPQVELYGLIGQRTLRDSYRNGINYWELYSNRDLEQGGSCTSGVEVTFARPFADTNYVLSVPYSAKSATAFTPTQTGDWIAKGKGLL